MVEGQSKRAVPLDQQQQQEVYSVGGAAMLPEVALAEALDGVAGEDEVLRQMLQQVRASIYNSPHMYSCITGCALNASWLAMHGCDHC